MEQLEDYKIGTRIEPNSFLRLTGTIEIQPVLKLNGVTPLEPKFKVKWDTKELNNSKWLGVNDLHLIKENYDNKI